jgi:hypothetical protein
MAARMQSSRYDGPSTDEGHGELTSLAGSVGAKTSAEAENLD